MSKLISCLLCKSNLPLTVRKALVTVLQCFKNALWHVLTVVMRLLGSAFHMALLSFHRILMRLWSISDHVS